MDIFFELPECFFNKYRAVTFLTLENVILRGNATYLDPLERLATLGSFTRLYMKKVRIIDPKVNHDGVNFPYTPIWSEIFEPMRNLLFIQITQCNLRGLLPTTLPTSLSGLDFSNNALSGSIPPTFKLSTESNPYINLDNNQLTGALPFNLVNGFFASSYLSIENNKISALPATFNASAKELRINARNNSISGTIPVTLFAGTHANSTQIDIDLSFNQLSGSIPPTLLAGAFSNLTKVYSVKLNISMNNLNGSFPNFWPSIQEDSLISRLSFDFSHNKIEGSLIDAPLLPPNTSEAYPTVFMVNYQLHHNKLSGSLPANLCVPTPRLWDFTVDLSYNDITGSIPQNITGKLSKFSLSLAHNKLTGTIPANLISLDGTEKVSIDLSDNKLSGTVPSNVLTPLVETPLSYTPNEVYLNLSYNSFTGPLPAVIRGKVRLVTAAFNNNRFTGTLNSTSLFPPPQDTAFRTGFDFFSFDAAHNALNGTLNIPDAPSPYKSSRVYLNLAYNQLNSLKVADTVNFIRGLNISDNARLAGTIPTVLFSNISDMTLFAASRTALTGAFPIEIDVSLEIEALDLADTGVTFCHSTREVWAPKFLSYCNLKDTSASRCKSSYPLVCIIGVTESPTGDAARVASTSSLILALLITLALFL